MAEAEIMGVALAAFAHGLSPEQRPQEILTDHINYVNTIGNDSSGLTGEKKINRPFAAHHAVLRECLNGNVDTHQEQR